MAIDKSKNLDYVRSITDIFTKDELYHAYRKDLEKGKSEARLIHRHNIKKLDSEWVKVIEDCLISLDTIVRNPRKFIVIEEDIIDISLAKSITTESVKHLAQHTNLISSVDKDGMVLPNKILNTSKEESYEVYENRFIYTLLQKLRDFVTKRFDLIKKAYSMSDEMLEISVDSAFNVGNKKMYYKQNLITALPSKEIIASDADLSNLERVAKINRIIGDFFSSPFAKQMVSSAPVRPPIQRTNVILKNQDFKKALMLWQFIETYDKTGFEVRNEDDVTPLEPEIKRRFLDIQYLNKLLYDAITSDKELAEGVDVVIDNKLADINSLMQKHGDAVDIQEKDSQKKDTKDDRGQEKPESDDKEEMQAEKSDDLEDDDYPQVAFDVPEIIFLYQKDYDKLRMTKTEIRRINLALDRALLQKRIQQEKADKKRADELRAKRKKIEAQQRALAQKAKQEKEKKLRQEALQKERALQREKEKEQAIERRKELERQAQLKAQMAAAREEEKRLHRERLIEARRGEAQEVYEFNRMLKEKLDQEKAKIFKEQSERLILAERQALQEKLLIKENKSNAQTKIRLENYKKSLYKQHEEEIAAAERAAIDTTAKKIAAIEEVLEDFDKYYGKTKKKRKEDN